MQKCPKSFPKVSKRVLNMFWVIFLENFFCPVFHGGSRLRKFSKKSKLFKNCKNARNRSQKCPNVFWTCLGVFFSKNFCPVFHGGSSLRKFSKKSKNFSKLQKSLKSFPKMSKRVLNMFWGIFFEKFFAQCSMEGRVFENFQKNQKFSKIPNKPKIVPITVQKCFEHILG